MGHSYLGSDWIQLHFLRFLHCVDFEPIKYLDNSLDYSRFGAIGGGYLLWSPDKRTQDERKEVHSRKKIFTELFIFECFYFIIDFFITQVSINGLFNLIVCVVPALAFAYITWSCNRIEKILLAGSNGSIVP